ncbi:oligopeptide ABC transporter permease [Priestia megaterium]|uniref:oligopeptide ABC transporter permease n=1 Tax=Priestia megaterium TaxID=1404 RepID=UPI002E24F46B|nr:oligopeptide ABC transporter permease [Priestia megaterium]MED4100903.1 ABC transporter permease [Priestia megaterium]
MLQYSLRRILGMIPMLILISFVVFSLAKMMPGDPFGGEINPSNTDPKYIEEMRDKLGYNDPIYVQYWNWVKGVAQGDLGKSTTHKLPTLDIILERMPNTIFLALTSLLITYVFAFILGMYAGRKPYTLADNFMAGYNYFALAVPSFIAGIVGIYLFSFQLGWFPFSGSVEVGLKEGSWEFIQSRIHHVILPALILGLMSTAQYTQFLRNDIIENSRKDFVRTARAKGTKESKIYNVHILRNSMIPLITFLGFDLVTIISGSIITETIFTYPGIGKLFVDSVATRDYSVMMSLTMLFSILTLVGNLVADLLYGVADPRIRLD